MDEKSKKTADIKLQISNFEVPPIKDILVIGKRSPIGSCGAVKCMEAIAPDQYILIPTKDNPVIEGILLRKNLLKIVSKEKLMQVIIDETENMMDHNTLYKVSVDITIIVNKTIDL